MLIVARMFLIFFLASPGSIHASESSLCKFLLGLVEVDENLTPESISVELREFGKGLKRFPQAMNLANYPDFQSSKRGNKLQRAKWTTPDIRRFTLNNFIYGPEVELALSQLQALPFNTRLLRRVGILVEGADVVRDYATSLPEVAGGPPRGFYARMFKRPTYATPDFVLHMRKVAHLAAKSLELPRAMSMFNAVYMVSGRDYAALIQALAEAPSITKSTTLEFADQIRESNHLAIQLTVTYSVDTATGNPKLLLLANSWELVPDPVQ